MSQKYDSDNYYKNRDKRQLAMNKWIEKSKDWLREYHMKRYDEELLKLGRTRRPKLTPEERELKRIQSNKTAGTKLSIERKTKKVMQLYTTIENCEFQIEQLQRQIKYLQDKLKLNDKVE